MRFPPRGMLWAIAGGAAIHCGSPQENAESGLFFQQPRWSLPLNELNTAEPPAGPAQSEDPFEKVKPSDLPVISADGDLEQLATAITRQLERCEQMDGGLTWKIAGRVVQRRQWCQETGNAFLKIVSKSKSWNEFWAVARTKFDWYRSRGRNNQGEVMFTGYFSPLLHADYKPSQKYYYPLYQRPENLERVTVDGKLVWRMKLADGSYGMPPSRKEIDWQGALASKKLELAWVDDRVEGFFLHIQGSGNLLFHREDGTDENLFVNYDAQNGHPYVAIGRVLREEGVPDEYLTMQGLKRYFEERPSEIDRVFPQNPSYVFFKLANSGPYGSGGTVLVPGHSIATDNRIFPLGAMCLIQTQKAIVENGKIVGWREMSRLALNQDTGGAITGPGRVDIFWGSGEYAELAAGAQQSLGGAYIALLPNRVEAELPDPAP